MRERRKQRTAAKGGKNNGNSMGGHFDEDGDEDAGVETDGSDEEEDGNDQEQSRSPMAVDVP